MKYNLLNLKRMYVEPGPYKDLSESELQLLRDGDTDTSGISVSGETMSIIADLGARYRTSNLRYYRQPAALENIAFFAKQGAAESFMWKALSPVNEGDYLTVDLSILDDRFELFRIVHTVATGTSEVYELQIFSEDSQILFGPKGQATVFSVDSGTSTLLAEEVKIFNATKSDNLFYCLPDGEDSDSEGLSISKEALGPFQALYESGLSLPFDFPWSSGQKDNVYELGLNLSVVSGTHGTFYTPVIDISSLEGRRLSWNSSSVAPNKIDDTSRDDSVFTISVRFSDVAPTDPGWSSGQLSSDLRWDTVSGTLPFNPIDNFHIINPRYFDYFQARIDFYNIDPNEPPILISIGIEEAAKLFVPAGESGSLFVKSRYSEHIPGRDTKLLVWSFESDNEEQ